MKSHATKLIDLTEGHAETISEQWYNNVKSNPKTPTYHGMRKEDAIWQALHFYRDLRSMFYTDDPFASAQKIFGKYADDRFKEGIPLNEAIYALILMRRHMWLFAEFQATFITAIEHQQAIESLNRTILVFDYAVYVIAKRYEEHLLSLLQKSDSSSKLLQALKNLSQRSLGSREHKSQIPV